MNKLLLSLLMIILIASMTLVACSDDDDTPVAAPTKTVEKTVEVPGPEKTVEVPGPTVEVTKEMESIDLELYTSKLGSTIYANAIALAMVVGKNSDTLDADAVPTEGGPSILRSFAIEDPSDIREKGMGFVTLSQFGAAKEGTGEDDPPYDTGHPIMWMNNAFLGYASVDSDIQTLEDLDGKNVAIMYAPVGPDYAFAAKLMELSGVQPNEQYMSGNSAADALLDGTLDAIWFSATYRGEGNYYLSSSATRLFTLAGDDLNVLTIPEEIMSAAIEESNHISFPLLVPKDDFDEGIPAEDTYVNGTMTFIFADETMSDDAVYEFLKTIGDNIDEVQQLSELLSALTVDDMANNLERKYPQEEWHPGALKYYQDAGVVQ